ncbi:translocase subunit seca [Thalictrum thalictroides]|uniref:Translocase subunit seca n=1 Tax=Thalictrum thalictroides TaxID=46969 RepID=A0A7J6WSN1_THATH|nr:translocase subunit seca [Thalictrum thalictroides]
MEKDFAVCEKMMSSVCISEKKDPLVCPIPRRFGPMKNTANDSKAGVELLDIILSRGGYDTENSNNHLTSSPPFFNGSPPSRATNPLVQDAHFEGRKLTPMSPLLTTIPSTLSSSPSSLTRKGGCARTKFGHKPAAVRIEGFDCLNRDRRNCSIPAVA